MTHFQTNQFIGETKQSLLPGYRYWLVERGGQKALFGISQIGGAFGAASAALALVVPDPDVAQQFADMLANEKKNQAPENLKEGGPAFGGTADSPTEGPPAFAG
ncbi:hypothetical protein [Rhizobium ruizarguesonis]|uniref:hypothetical protein n=2 Tax=Rhizobium ruizarguesonis TaxID=2081791 RepID=UPI001FEDE8DD|nr:hypothetical protein [Rhizobium ruizarguesonis]